ncbi:MAG: hypothetical protein JWP12_3474 [Bacteroidetes bacterium]|nr:hypothetical protein [Bacteroidota bacterium]
MKLLKLLVFAGVLTTLALSGGCRKKTEAEMDMATKPLHCYNEEMDADETLPDFGGSCGTGSAAVSLTSDCSMTNNTADLTTSFGSTVNYTVSSCVKTVSGGYFTYNLTLSGGNYIHVKTTSAVLVNHELTLTTSTPAASDECEIDFYMSGIAASCSSSGIGTHVSIKYNGTNYAINICNAPWYASSYGGIDAYAMVN